MFEENKKYLNELLECRLKELLKDLDKEFNNIFFSMLEEYNEIEENEIGEQNEN